jgi:aconitate hydratase
VSVVKLNLSDVVPLAACPHSPDNVKTVSELADIKVDQVCLGSCTNSSYADLTIAAALLDGKTVAENVQLSVAPGSKQVFEMLAASGGLQKLIAAGARILECACGPCIGMGQSPNTDGVSLRTFNRNFEGRSGTKSGQAYLVSVETAVASALSGRITAATNVPTITIPEKALINDNMLIPPLPPEKAATIEIFRGPNIKPFPVTTALPTEITAPVILKTGDNITTDHIMPAGAKILPLRSNIPAISRHCFTAVDESFPKRALAAGKGFIIGGENYGQGSSREHAALAPLYLGVKAVITKSFARIHQQNLINAGIIPLVFENADDYEKIAQGDTLRLPDIRSRLADGFPIVLENTTKGIKIPVKLNSSARSVKILLAGGLLNIAK